MFFLLLGTILILFISLQRKAARLSIAKPVNALKLSSILAIATMISIGYAHLHQPESTGEGIETFAAKEGDIMVQIPKRLFDPKRWFEMPAEQDFSKFKNSESIPYHEIYDRKLIIGRTRTNNTRDPEFIFIFSLNSQDSLKQRLLQSAVKSPEGEFNFNEDLGLNFQYKHGQIHPKSHHFVPFLDLKVEFNKIMLSSSAFKEQIPGLVVFHKKGSSWYVSDRPKRLVFEAGFPSKHFNIGTKYTRQSFLCIPYFSTEELVEVSLEKCMSLMSPRNIGSYSQFIPSLNYTKIWKCWSFAPLYGNRHMLIISLIFISVIATFLKCFKPILIITILTLSVIWHKYHESIFTNQLTFLSNQYCRPKSRHFYEASLKQVDTFSVTYDIMKFKLAVEKMQQYPPVTARCTECINATFNKVIFSDHHNLIDIYSLNYLTGTVTSSTSGHHFMESNSFYSEPLIISYIKKLRNDGESAKDFLFDPRLFAIRPVESTQRPDETEDAWLRREFTTFYTDLFQTETAALETAQ